jgi:hypothetical protein
MSRQQRTGNGLDYYFVVNMQNKKIIDKFRNKKVAKEYMKEHLMFDLCKILTKEEYDNL